LLEVHTRMSLKSIAKAVAKASKALAPEAIEVADRIWGYAEEPFKEFRSAAAVRESLAGHGFAVEQEFASIPTAFAMAAGRGKPRIGILAEYDALPDCGLRKGTWGHGCGHNLLGGGSLLAALITAEVMRQRRLRGSVVLYGCPAEETLAGKVYMARDGAFTGLAAALAWHPGAATAVSLGGGSAMDTYAFEFFGKTAHGAYAHGGRSALDAVELMDHAVNILREHIPENVRIHSVITCGGGAPNVVPAYARSWLYVRGVDREQVDAIAARILRCARGAALATETRCKVTLLTACYNRLPSEALADHLHACLTTLGPPPFGAADRRALGRLKLTGKLSAEIGDIQRAAGRASSDQDSVSWLAPLGVLGVACAPKGVNGHHRDTTRLGREVFAHKGMVHAGEALAVAALSLLGDAKLRGKVAREFRRRTRGFTYDPIVPAGQLPPIRDRIPKEPPSAPGGLAENRA